MARKALLIGINRYRIPGGDLRGCVNDVESIRHALNKHCGFAASEITPLVDGQATTRNMQGRSARCYARPNVATCYCCTTLATARMCPTRAVTRRTFATRFCARPTWIGRNH